LRFPVDDRADVGSGLQRVINFQSPKPFQHRGDETIVNAGGDDQPRGRSTALAGREKRTVDGAIHRDFEISIVEHQQRILAAHLQGEFLQVLGGFDGEFFADVGRARKRNHFHARIAQQYFADILRGSRNHVQHAGRQFGLMK